MALLLTVMLLGSGRSATAQEAGKKLFISSSDASSAPTIVLRAYGMDAQGAPLNLAAEPLVVQHNSQPASNVTVAGSYQAGTFTIFVVDLPEGVGGQLGAIQQAIEQFAAAPNMLEQADYVAIYRIGEAQADELLTPTNFYNTVRNFFATPLELQSGPTALVDSLVTLLNGVEAIKPKADVYTSLVVMSDGTDVVSTQFAPGDVATRASELSIPVHTIWVDNESLQQAGKEAGQQYLAEVAAGSRGLAARLDQPGEVQAIWSRIASFRDHTVVQYTADNVAGGDYQVVVSLQSDPNARDETTVTVPAGAPSVTINLPPESREITLPSLDTPVQLSFSTTVTWLDGVPRQLTSAELLVNGVVVQNIDVNNIERFTAQISNFQYGTNTVQVAVVDEQGRRATSPEIALVVNEGATNIPEDVQAGGGLLSSNAVRIALGCLVVLFLLALLAAFAFAARRWRILHRLGLAGALRRVPFLRPYFQDAAEVQHYARQADRVRREVKRYAPRGEEPEWEERAGEPEQWPATQPFVPGGQNAPYLEVLDSVTRMPPRIELTAVENRIGRSPAQADIVFENDITVSRLHASIVQEGEEYHIYDENSTSGTWVNEQRLTEYGHLLQDGDEIRLGAARLRFRWG
ncbi:MAG: FHA domain-containing protein [Chloroflexi bacterium]|nr:FHA domain-containing protein [Chloroflexota bacterium]MCI0574819.1 FHA domain-containing protein [Chloroflexota bacterium]MCI0648290.1 FHA domain-containing protein [Chloroflexota bacterium]MCI0728418.1 FHA domain-containing protein [Chloroflexota bacterium]